MARSCQALRETPEGAGTSQRMTPVAIEAARGFKAAPCQGAGAAAGAAEAEAEARTTGIRERRPWLEVGVNPAGKGLWGADGKEGKVEL